MQYSSVRAGILSNCISVGIRSVTAFISGRQICKISLKILVLFQVPVTPITNYLTESTKAQALCLLAMILVLPSLEAPKTVFLVLYLLLFVWSLRPVASIRSLNLGDYLLLAWGVIGFVVAGFADIHHKEWSGARSAVQIPLLLMCVKNTRFSANEVKILLTAIVISTLTASVEGAWQLFSHKMIFLELNSVGHVNHSSIYICLTYAVALAFVISQSNPGRWLIRTLWIVAALILAVLIVVSKSRGSLLAMAALTLFYGLIWTNKSKKPFALLMVASLLFAGGLYLTNASIVKKTVYQANSPVALNSLSGRVPLWNSSLLMLRHYPAFGVGIENFDQITREIQEKWLAEEHKQYSEQAYHPYKHGHSFYFNTLAEQGLVGFSVIFANLLYICYLLYKHVPKNEDTHYYWLIWLSAAGVMLVILINGMFNTTLHHEHGLLSALILGFWLASVKFQTDDRTV